jgi:hypothetical protein
MEVKINLQNMEYVLNLSPHHAHSSSSQLSHDPLWILVHY